MLYNALQKSWDLDSAVLPREQLVVRNGNMSNVCWVTAEASRLIVQPMEASVATSMERSRHQG